MLNPYFHLIDDYNLGKHGYIDSYGKSYNNSNNIWQVWQKMKHARTIGKIYYENKYIEFCNKSEAVFGIKKTGKNVGQCFLEWSSDETNMLWAKPKNGANLDDIFRILNTIVVKHSKFNGTIGSIGKQDINKYLEETI